MRKSVKTLFSVSTFLKLTATYQRLGKAADAAHLESLFGHVRKICVWWRHFKQKYISQTIPYYNQVKRIPLALSFPVGSRIKIQAAKGGLFVCLLHTDHGALPVHGIIMGVIVPKARDRRSEGKPPDTQTHRQ